jgi:hypothetical protein
MGHELEERLETLDDGMTATEVVKVKRWNVGWTWRTTEILLHFESMRLHI